MTKLLDGVIAVVTGGGSGIGQAIAIGYAEQGATLALLDVNTDGAQSTRAQIEQAGGTARVYELNVSDTDACRTVASRVSADMGQASVLVNSAGINRRTPFTGDREVLFEDWRNIMSVNLDGVFNVTHAFLAPLRATKGRVVNIASVQSFVHVRTPTTPAYTTSKHGVLGLTRALAAELGPEGVRVNAIGPGLIETPLNADTRASGPDLIQTFMNHTPLGRVGQPQDIVGPAVFLASEMSAYVTGSIVMVDGGYRTV